MFGHGLLPFSNAAQLQLNSKQNDCHQGKDHPDAFF
jgi:hypothetical protein